MKSYLRVINNIILSSIGISVSLGSLLIIIGPINQINQVGKSRKFIEKQVKSRNSEILIFLENNDKIKSYKSLEKLILKWENIINKNDEIEVSAFFLSLDNKTFAEINPDIKLPAASSIKIPILIVLLMMLDQGEVLWNEELTLTEEIISGGSGWMAYEKIGKKFPIFEVATEMIRVSDNTATNLLIKRIGGIGKVNKKFKDLGLTNTQINSYLPDLEGTNLTSTKELSLAMALVDNGYFLTSRSRDIFREIMSKSITNTLIPKGILQGMGKQSSDIDYHLSIRGFTVYNKTGDIGISYSDTGLIQTPYNSRAYASFIVKGQFNDPRSPELIRNLAAELIPFLGQDQNTTK